MIDGGRMSCCAAGRAAEADAAEEAGWAEDPDGVELLWGEVVQPASKIAAAAISNQGRTPDLSHPTPTAALIIPAAVLIMRAAALIMPTAALRPKAWFIPAQGNALGSWSFLCLCRPTACFIQPERNHFNRAKSFAIIS